MRRQVLVRLSDASPCPVKVARCCPHPCDSSSTNEFSTEKQRPSSRIQLPVPPHVLGDIKNRLSDHRHSFFSYSAIGNTLRNQRQENGENKENIVVRCRKYHAGKRRRGAATAPENVEDTDTECAVPEINVSAMMNEGRQTPPRSRPHGKSQIEDDEVRVTLDDSEPTCRANRMPQAQYKRKSDLHARSHSCFRVGEEPTAHFVPTSRMSSLKPVSRLQSRKAPLHSNIQPLIAPALKEQRREGYLEKYSPKFLGSWKQRYCTLEHRSFSYVMEKGTQRLKCCVNFDLVSCTVALENSDNPRKFQYRFLPKKRAVD